MGALFSNCQLFLAKRQAIKGNRKCGVILRNTEEQLVQMRQKYEEQLDELQEAITIAKHMPQSTSHERDKRKKRLLDLLTRRKMLSHYVTQTDKRLHMINSKMLALDQLQISQMQLDAVRSTAQAFQTFQRRVGGLDSIEDATDKLSEQMSMLTDLTQVLEDQELYPMLDMDESDLMDELDEMEDETPVGPAAAINVAVEDLLPSAPTGSPKHAATNSVHFTGVATGRPRAPSDPPGTGELADSSKIAVALQPV